MALKQNGTFIENRFEIDINEAEDSYLMGHVVEDRVTFPASGYILLVWKTFAKTLKTTYNKLPVIFYNVKVLKPVFLSKDKITFIGVSLCNSNGYFEVYSDDIIVCTGKVSTCRDVSKIFLDYSPPKSNLYLTQEEFYTDMDLRGFHYSGIFKGVQKSDANGQTAYIKWSKNYVAFIDCMIQFVLSLETTGFSLPKLFQKIVIDPAVFNNTPNNYNLILHYDNEVKAAKCGGIEIRKIYMCNEKRRFVDIPPVLRKCTFVSNIDSGKEEDPFSYSLAVAAQIVVENTSNLNVKIGCSERAMNILKSTLDRIYLLNASFQRLESLDDADYCDLLVTEEKCSTNRLHTYLAQVRFVFSQIPNKLEDIQVVYKYCEEYALLQKEQHFTPQTYTVVEANNNNYKWIENLQAALEKQKSPTSRIYLLNKDLNSGIVGIFNTCRLEQLSPNLRVFLIRKNNIEEFSPSSKFYSHQIEKDLTVNVFDGSWGTYRRLPLNPFLPSPKKDARLIKNDKGLKWVQKSPFIKTNVTVHFASLSKWDFLLINDRAGQDSQNTQFLGMEYSGITQEGIKVMGLLPRGAVATSVVSHPQLVWNFPVKRFSLEEAATIPLPYTLSYYSLFIKYQLAVEQSILIHNSTTDISLAAIAFALYKGCTVYTIAESEHKLFLESKFPRMKEHNAIIDSSKSQFSNGVLKRTKGKGVDVVFNCNSVELLRASKECLATNGSFIEVGNRAIDFVLDDDFGNKHYSFYHIDIGEIFSESEEVQSYLKLVVARSIQDGTAFPFQSKILEPSEISVAHTHPPESKCLIRLINEEKMLAYSRTYFNPNKSFIIVGGLGGFGFELCKFLIKRGVTKLILNSRHEIKSEQKISLIQKWNRQGLAILTNTYNSCNIEEAENLLKSAAALAPLGGIFNSALHFQPGPLPILTPEHFLEVAKPKILSAQNLDILSRRNNQDLDYFVLFSSLTASLGREALANHAHTGSAMERLCETRRKDGLHGLVVEWGEIASVGILKGQNLDLNSLEARQDLASCFEVLDQVLQQGEAVVSSSVYGRNGSTKDV